MSKRQATAIPFTHLHVHTHYSLLDGANRIGELVRQTQSLGMSAIAITDHGNLFGAIEFYQAALEAGVKPILGMEAYIAPGDRRSKDTKGISEASYHLLLLAMNNEGYRNLLKLSSIAYLEGFYYRPRIDREVLQSHSGGLICTSGCLGAEIPQALVGHDRARVEEIADWYLKLFGPERFYIELQDHGMDEQRMINPELADLARRKGLGLIATNDVHYLTREDVEAHDVLCCISTRSLQHEENRFKFPSDQFFLKPPQEMADLFSAWPESISNTQIITDRCNVDLDFKKRYTPVYHPPEQKTPEAYLRELVYRGAQERYGKLTQEIRDRIDYELEVIESKGFSSYFLIVWDFVHFARAHGIPAGARGSGCSSIVAYCLRISQPDPLRYGLYFERFMDPDRDEMPDIDIDMCQDGRERVIQYVREKYGHVAQIITFGTLKARAAIRDVCRVLGVPLGEADKVAKLVPEELKMTLDKALAREPDLKRRYDEDPAIRRVIDIGRRLEGMARNVSIHAAGVVIADEPLDGLLPLYKPPDSDVILTQFEGTTVEKVGLLKMDFLGLRTLSVLARACELVRRHHGVDVDLERIDLKDPKVFELFAAGQTKGIFQFESGGMRGVLMRMRPNRIEDLIAANALYRPGPMTNIDAYVARKHGERWTTPHKIMSEVLEETYGIIVYQEQVARLVNQLGGIERKRAFRLAKAISKKKTAMIEAEREPFVAGAVKNGLKKDAAEQVFSQILPFGEYAFNKAHSTGYALVAYQTAYMRAYYPIEFMAALLTYEMVDTNKVVEYIEECRRLGIDVKPPDVNSSDADFTVVDATAGGGRRFLRFGLAAIKGVGRKAVTAIAEARTRGGRFANLYDFCERVDLSVVNRGVVEALIKAGAFDSTGAMRKALTLVLDRALSVGAEAQRDREAGQLNMFGDLAGGGEPAAMPQLSSDQWSEAEMLANEKAVLGFYVTSHPLARHEDMLRKFTTACCADLPDLPDGADVVLGGMVSRIRTTLTKTGRYAGSKMGILTFEDLTGAVEATVFSEEFDKYRSLIRPDAIAFLRGRIDRRREEPSVRVSEVFSIEDAPARLAQSVIVRLVGDAVDPGVLRDLRAICSQHPGEQPLFLQVHANANMVATLRCDAKLGIRPDAEFVAQVEALLGPRCVTVVGPTRPAGYSVGAERRHSEAQQADELEATA